MANLFDLIRAQMPSQKNYLQLIRDELRAVDGELTNLGGFIQILPEMKNGELERVLVSISGKSQIWIAQIEKTYVKLFYGNVMPEQFTKVYSISCDLEYDTFLIALAGLLAKIIKEKT